MLIGLLVGFMIDFFSPVATLSMGDEERITFWISLCLVGGAGMFVCDLILTGLQMQWPGWAMAFLKSVCGCVAVLIPLYHLYDPSEIPSFGTTALFIWLVMVLILAGASILYVSIAQTQLVPSNSGNIDVDLSDADMKSPSVAQAETPAKILSRLPVHLQSSDLYALSAEDHYVRVYTSKGDDLVLMRFSDAVLETGDVEGARIHRSWWVAKSAIIDINAKGRGAEITMKNDHKAPVSRAERKTLREMGWL